MEDTQIFFAQPFTVNADLVERLAGRVVVLDIAFCADTDRSTYASTTLPFIRALSDRLALWLDHHEHERHADFADDPRFILHSRRDYPATPEMITPEIVARAGEVDTIVAHGDLDGIYAAAKFLLDGAEPYSGADADARAADSRQGTLSAIAEQIDHALKADLSDDALRQTILCYLTSRCHDEEAWATILQRASAYKEIAQRTARWASQYALSNGIAVVDIREETERLDLTQLLLAGQRLAPVAVVRNRNLSTGEPQITVAVASDSAYNLVELFRLKGGMPTRVNIPDEQFKEIMIRLRSLTT